MKWIAAVGAKFGYIEQIGHKHQDGDSMSSPAAYAPIVHPLQAMGPLEGIHALNDMSPEDFQDTMEFFLQ